MIQEIKDIFSYIKHRIRKFFNPDYNIFKVLPPFYMRFTTRLLSIYKNDKELIKKTQERLDSMSFVYQEFVDEFISKLSKQEYELFCRCLYIWNLHPTAFDKYAMAHTWLLLKNDPRFNQTV